LSTYLAAKIVVVLSQTLWRWYTYTVTGNAFVCAGSLYVSMEVAGDMTEEHLYRGLWPMGMASWTNTTFCTTPYGVCTIGTNQHHLFPYFLSSMYMHHAPQLNVNCIETLNLPLQRWEMESSPKKQWKTLFWFISWF
jgi:hypothetical protein